MLTYDTQVNGTHVLTSGGGQGQRRNSWPACWKLPGGRWSKVASRRPSLLPQLLMGGDASGMSWVCRHQARKSSAVSQMRMRQGRQPGASFAKAFLCSQGSPGRAHHLQLSTLSASFTSSHPARVLSSTPLFSAVVGKPVGSAPTSTA